MPGDAGRTLALVLAPGAAVAVRYPCVFVSMAMVLTMVVNMNHEDIDDDDDEEEDDDGFHLRSDVVVLDLEQRACGQLALLPLLGRLLARALLSIYYCDSLD